MNIETVGIIAVLAPLTGALIAGLFGKVIGTTASHRITISLVALATVCSFYIAKLTVLDGQHFEGVLYTWAVSGSFSFHIGFMLDPLSSMMMCVVTFVSTLVHIYSIGYMAGDSGYQRFFSYMSLFTFAMLMLVTSDNFLQLFFGWEGVGLVSYLLIGFWFTRERAVFGSLKAFLVNRVGDFGFILGIALVLNYCGSLTYTDVFKQAPGLVSATIDLVPGWNVSLLTAMCIALFVGAMGKSAQMPLHVWLPASMEGPTPISALIHAATMVTAGVFMVARLSPLYQLSQTALSFVLVVGATSALFTGFIAVVQHDIKKVVAYSTLSQLGYMVAGLGASAFGASIFHLFTHAFFKALLFLGAGSVIIAMHHEQDMRKMGNLKKYMPITYVTFLIGTLSLSAVPGFAGFYSKEAIIEAVKVATVSGSTYAYYCVLIGAFVTALYSFRALILAFHGKEKMSADAQSHLKESPWVVTLPLVILAVPSVIIGAVLAYPLLYASPTLFAGSIKMIPSAHEYHGWFAAILHSIHTVPFYFASAGIIVAVVVYGFMPSLPAKLAKTFSFVHQMLMNKYGFDDFNQIALVHGTQKVGDVCYRRSDQAVIDGFVNGAGRLVNKISMKSRSIQTGYLYHYAFVMIIGLLALLSWMVF